VIELPVKWPGRSLVRRALTFARVIGAWSTYLDGYSKLNKLGHKREYHLFRDEWYYRTKIDDHEGNRIGR
jgi:hypothetical protein